MATARLQQAHLYLSQQRYAEAVRVLREELSQSPEDIQALLFLSEAYIGTDEKQQALATIRQAMQLAPDADFIRYQHARILFIDEQDKAALSEIEATIQMNPIEADYYALRGALQLRMKQYAAALDSADAGLALDPDSGNALNVRAQALVKLNRAEAAFDTIATSLESDPENSYTHTNMGWSKLETGQHQEALTHFREALRLQPTNDYAKAGMVEAIKAKNVFYRLFLRYNFWMAKLSAKYQWGFIIGIYVIYRILLGLMDNFPQWKPILLPLIILYVAFAFSTWFMEPIANLFLLVNPFGRYALDKQERLGATLVGTALLVCVLSLLTYLAVGSAGLLGLAVFSFTMMIPLGSMLKPPSAKAVRQMVVYTSVLAFFGLLSVFFIWVQNDIGAGGIWPLLYLGGIFVYQWVLNAKMTKY